MEPPDLDRVAAVLVAIVQRRLVQHNAPKEGDDDADGGVLQGLDGGTG
jgi:hypothetical protein